MVHYCRDIPHFDPNLMDIFCTLLIQYEPTSCVIATLVTIATLFLARFRATFVANVLNVLRNLSPIPIDK